MFLIIRPFGFINCLILGTSLTWIFGCSSFTKPGDSLTTQEPFIRELIHLAGSNEKNCGIVDLQQDQRAAYRCATESLSLGQPFFVGVQLQGIDSEIWTGIASASDGKLWKVNFDSDVTGSSSFSGKPSLRTIRCASVQFSSIDWVPPFCQEIVYPY